MRKIIFFNHYHRGDIFTHRQFIKHLQSQLPEIEFEYLHFNHPKLTRDLNIPLVGSPEQLNQNTKFYFNEDKSCFYVNTWIGCDDKYMREHSGLNMHAMYNQWDEIYSTISKLLNKEISLYPVKEQYLPTIDYQYFNLTNIDSYVKENLNKKRILICNGSPKSGQSFAYDMTEFINYMALKHNDVDIICTQKINKTLPNILFTDDLIGDTETVDKRAPWEDKENNICDLLEISYLSEFCDVIVGKNSGPSAFCETFTNYMNPNKHIILYVVRWNSGNIMAESLSYNLDIKCQHEKVLIEQPNLSLKDVITITDTLSSAIERIKN